MERWGNRRLGLGDACHAFPGTPLRLRVRFGTPAVALRMLRFAFVRLPIKAGDGLRCVAPSGRDARFSPRGDGWADNRMLTSRFKLICSCAASSANRRCNSGGMRVMNLPE